jgi:hypothetical protein
VAAATANGGLTLVGTEGATLGILLPTATDALSATTSTGSGLELSSAGLSLLQGCSDGQILKWNEASDVWGCQDDAQGTGASPIGASGGVITKNTAGDQFYLTMAEAGDYGLKVDASVAPTVDLVQLTNTGYGVATNAVDLMSLNFTTANSQTGSNTNAALQIDVTSGTVTSGTPNVYGINIGNITGQTAANEAAINIGTGWDNALVANGNIKLEARPNTNAAADLNWTVISGTAGTIGDNSTTAIASVSATAVYNGSLYVGTSKADSAEVYRYDGPTLGTWTKVSQSTAGTIAASGTASIDRVTTMVVWNGYLYAGTFETDKAEVYRYDGGTTWTKVSQTTAGTISSGGTSAIDGIGAMAVYNGSIYAGTREGGKAEIYRYDGGTSWTRVSTTTPGTIITTTAVDSIDSMIVFNNSLYAGGRKASTADIYRYTGGTVWTRVVSAINAATAISAMAVWNGKLYFGTEKANAAAVYRWDDSGITGSTNTVIVSNNTAGTIKSGGTSAIDRIAGMTVYNGRLYVSTNEADKAEIYRYDGGDGAVAASPPLWTLVSRGPAGTLVAGGTSAVDGAGILQQYGSDLLAFTDEYNGGTSKAEVIKYTTVTDQSYALKFHAASSLLGGEQNGLLNEASITFVASSSSSWYQGAQTTGNFIFSHGIRTAYGAYDVAEDYPTRDDSLEVGDVVAVDTREQGMVVKSGRIYDPAIVGVYSETPALRLAQLDTQINGGRAIPVALAGRVPVKVSTENGPIAIGDTLTSSSIPGVAMKATKAGAVIGRAMEAYQGEGVGKVMAFVNVSSIGGIGVQVVSALDNIGEVAPQATQAAGLSTIVTDRLVASEIQVGTISASQIDGLSELITAEASTAAARGFAELQSGWLDQVFARLTSWLAEVRTLVFGGNVTFIGQVGFGRSSAGEVTLPVGQTEIHVEYETAYARAPIVAVTPVSDGVGNEQVAALLLSGDVRYILVGRTEHGFTIRVNRTLETPLTFTWTAVLAPAQSAPPAASPAPTVAPSASPSPTPVVTSPEASASPSPPSTPVPSASNVPAFLPSETSSASAVSL